MKTDTKILPFFPLGVFLLPGEDIPLRIFEPRYLQLIEDAKDEGFTFAIPFIKNDEILEYGCEVKLQQVVAETDAGRKVITVESLSLIKVLSYTDRLADKLYSGGRVEVLPSSGVIDNPGLVNTIIEYVHQYDEEFLNNIQGAELRYCDVLKSLKLSSEDKYGFLELKSDVQREKFLASHLKYLMMIRKQEKSLDDDFRLN